MPFASNPSPALGKLYLIPNSLGDGPLAAVLTPGVFKITAGLAYFVGENAKSTRAFLKKIGAVETLAKPMQEIVIRELNVSTPAQQLPELIAPLLAGHDAGLVSEAGCPAVADPGANLVRLAHEHGITVCPLIGPSSILLALMASGMNGQSFAFNGYLPTDAAERARRIQALEQRSRQDRQTQIFIETPYRNTALMEALVNSCSAKTLIGIAVDLSLPTEFICTKTAAAWRGVPTDLQKRPCIFLMLAA
jgi:16S rRNA (cytidine1402-2'-O)-methyltransferase